MIVRADGCADAMQLTRTQADVARSTSFRKQDRSLQPVAHTADPEGPRIQLRHLEVLYALSTTLPGPFAPRSWRAGTLLELPGTLFQQTHVIETVVWLRAHDLSKASPSECAEVITCSKNGACLLPNSDCGYGICVNDNSRTCSAIDRLELHTSATAQMPVITHLIMRVDCAHKSPQWRTQRCSPYPNAVSIEHRTGNSAKLRRQSVWHRRNLCVVSERSGPYVL